VETDGTLRWVLVDFQDDVGAGATQRYLLRTGNSAARPSAVLEVHEGAEAVTVDTGRIRLVVDKEEPFGLFREVTAGGPNEVYQFASHRPPKDDSVLETARLFYEAARPRDDAQPPAAVKDLTVKLLGDGRAEVEFTAPADAGGGQVVRYQVKAATLPIAAYEEWDYAWDSGKRRNWWKAVNLTGEPKPGRPGSRERFGVSGVPPGEALYFAVRSFDDSENRSGLSNVAVGK